MEKPTKRKVELNLVQFLVANATQEYVVMECSRGVGKSTILAEFIRQAVTQMPRSKGALSGVSYATMMRDTLPSTIQGLEKLGWYKDVHYFIGRRSPNPSWPEPFEPPTTPTAWNSAIHFFTGACIILISQDPGKPESRGHNFDWMLADEAAQQDEKRLSNEVFAALRTWRPEFRDKPMYHRKAMVSSTAVTKAGQWFLRYEQLARENPKKYLFISADSRFNRMNLKPGWAEEMRENYSSETAYNAEIRNIRPNLTVNGFYPMLRTSAAKGKPSHYYLSTDQAYYLNDGKEAHLANDCRKDRDRHPDLPLILDFDPGASINVLVVKQYVPSRRELRTLKSFYRLSPSIIQDLFAQDFLPYYAAHKRKEISLFFDRTAYNSVANSALTVADEVVAILRAAGYTVHMRAQRGVLRQHDKYHIISAVMREETPDGLLVRINKDNNPDLCVAMENAEAYENSKGQIQKDKRSEARKSTPRQHATDYTDAWDLSTVYHARTLGTGQNEVLEVQMK